MFKAVGEDKPTWDWAMEKVAPSGFQRLLPCPLITIILARHKTDPRGATTVPPRLLPSPRLRRFGSVSFRSVPFLNLPFHVHALSIRPTTRRARRRNGIPGPIRFGPLHLHRARRGGASRAAQQQRLPRRFLLLLLLFHLLLALAPAPARRRGGVPAGSRG